MACRLVIFDFDGTLADSFPWFLRVINSVADAYRFKRVEDHEIETLRGQSARQIMRHLGVAPWKMPLIARHMRALMRAEAETIPLFAGVEVLLRRLSEHGITLAIVSSNTESNVRTVLGPQAVALIDHFACGAALFGKESKLKTVLKRSGVAPTEAIAIGDEIRDIEAARIAGVPCGAVAWGYTRADALAAHRPDALYASLDEIAATLTLPLPGGL